MNTLAYNIIIAVLLYLSTAQYVPPSSSLCIYSTCSECLTHPECAWQVDISSENCRPLTAQTCPPVGLWFFKSCPCTGCTLSANYQPKTCNLIGNRYNVNFQCVTNVSASLPSIPDVTYHRRAINAERYGDVDQYPGLTLDDGKYDDDEKDSHLKRDINGGGYSGANQGNGGLNYGGNKGEGHHGNDKHDDDKHDDDKHDKNDDKDQKGDDKDQKGDDKDQKGDDKDQKGDDRDQKGDDKDHKGDDKDHDNDNDDDDNDNDNDDDDIDNDNDNDDDDKGDDKDHDKGDDDDDNDNDNDNDNDDDDNDNDDDDNDNDNDDDDNDNDNDNNGDNGECLGVYLPVCCCIEDLDCDDSSYCLYSSSGPSDSGTCVAFEQLGGICGGFLLPHFQHQCHPSLTCILNPLLPDLAGHCGPSVPYGK